MWEPLVTSPAERERIASVIADIAAAVQPSETIDGLSDLAVFRSYIAEMVPDDADLGGDALSRAVALLGDVGGSLGLFGGAARVGWLVAHVADGETANHVCDAIDGALLRHIDDASPPRYELITGLVGLGVYALERGEAGRPLAVRVLDVLERRARPCGGGIAWFTPPEQLVEWQREDAPHGYWNLGVAHGVPGVIALLARYVNTSVEPERSARLLDGAVAYLLGAEPASSPRYPAWHAEGSTSAPPKARLAWCYGDLGIALALHAAASARERADWSAEALALARNHARDSLADSLVRDAGICHGAAGVTHLFHRLHRATGDAELRTVAQRWLDHTLTMRSAEPFAGFPASRSSADGERAWVADASLLTGAIGVGLVLAAAISDLEPRWDRLLLVDV